MSLGGWVRRFGYDLVSEFLTRAARGALHGPALVVYALPLPRQSHGWTASRFLRPRERLRCRSQINGPFCKVDQAPPHADFPSVPTSKPIAPRCPGVWVGPQRNACARSYKGACAKGLGRAHVGVGPEWRACGVDVGSARSGRRFRSHSVLGARARPRGRRFRSSSVSLVPPRGRRSRSRAPKRGRVRSVHAPQSVGVSVPFTRPRERWFARAQRFWDAAQCFCAAPGAGAFNGCAGGV
jgi:hypothetical protein